MLRCVAAARVPGQYLERRGIARPTPVARCLPLDRRRTAATRRWPA